MKEIPLTKGQVALVDDEDYERVAHYKWCVATAGNTSYALANVPNDEGTRRQKTLRMHRVIMDAPKGIFVDHVDGNGLNNQKSNLRLVSKRQNTQNYPNRKTAKTSQYPGVYWNKDKQKWHARINYGNQCVRLGYFKNEIDAFRAYYDEVLKLGEEVVGFPYPSREVDA